MNRHERRRDAAKHLRLASSNGKEQPAPTPKQPDPASVPWCVHEEARVQPRYAVGTRVRYLETGPTVTMRGATAVVVTASQRLCRLMSLGMWQKSVTNPHIGEVVNRHHDEPAYFLDHITLRDGRTRLDMQELAFPIWAAESWIEPLIKTG